jgi:MscS family membrane protein
MHILRLLAVITLLSVGTAPLRAEGAASTPAPASAPAKPADSPANAEAKTNAVAMATSPDLIEHVVDVILEKSGVDTSGNTNTITHWSVFAALMIAAWVLRTFICTTFFNILKHFASKTETTLDDKLFHALEAPVATLITVAGAVAALKVLKLSDTGDRTLIYASTVAFSLAVFWLLLRGFNALLDHAQEVAVKRQLGIAAFMPWIKKSLVVIFVVFGVLMIAQSLGADVKAFLAGLGLGGLAFALAAQDTLANIFGSVVVAIDQPFKLGETVRIGSEVGTIEDIGLRSTKIRKLDRSLMVIPNKSVAGENITNLSRFNGRRVELVLGLTYNTTAAQMEELVGEVRRLLLAEAEIDPASVTVYFRDFSASSMDIWIVFNVLDPDFHKHMALRQRLNLAFMRAIEARGLSMAYPTQTLYLEGAVARQLAGKAVQN